MVSTLHEGSNLKLSYKEHLRTSLLAQWMGICLPKPATRVPSLFREDSTYAEQLSPCTTATEPTLWEEEVDFDQKEMLPDSILTESLWQLLSQQTHLTLNEHPAHESTKYFIYCGRYAFQSPS